MFELLTRAVLFVNTQDAIKALNDGVLENVVAVMKETQEKFSNVFESGVFTYDNFLLLWGNVVRRHIIQS